MKVVIDANVIISSLIKKGLTKKLILHKKIQFITPSFTLTEVYKYKDYISGKAGITSKEFYEALEILFKYIKIINYNRYLKKIQEAKRLIRDIDDVPYLALALETECPIWSDDKHFKKQSKVRIYTTDELVRKDFEQA